MRGLWLMLVLLLLASGHAFATATTGLYIWGGSLTVNSGPQQFYDTVSAAVANGFTVIRFTIGPGNYSSNTGYINIDPAGICTGAPSLACYANLMFASKVWDNSAITTIDITTQDWTCYNLASDNNGCLTASYLTANAAAIEAEYTALLNVFVSRFGTRFTNGSLRIILSNWEGDNFVYCGAVYGFATSGATAAACQATWVGGQTNVQRVQAFLQWVGLKDATVASFLMTYPSANLVSAPELNNMFIFTANGGGNCFTYCNAATDTVYDQIVASGKRGWCSYSSYDAWSYADKGSYPAAVYALTGNACTNLIIGESGRDYVANPGAQVLEYWSEVISIQNLLGVQIIIPWNGVSPCYPTCSQNFGMFNPNGSAPGLPYIGTLRPTRPTPVLWH